MAVFVQASALGSDEAEKSSRGNAASSGGSCANFIMEVGLDQGSECVSRQSEGLDYERSARDCRTPATRCDKGLPGCAERQRSGVTSASQGEHTAPGDQVRWDTEELLKLVA